MNNLNLDAPIVAVLWQEAAAFALQSHLHWGHRILILLAVWTVYCTDRLLDVADYPTLPDHTAHRHQFHWKYQFRLRIICQAIGVITLGMAFANLNSEAWKSAAFVSGCTAIHFILSHYPNLISWPILKKEIRVGWIFAAGCLIQPAALRQVENPHIAWIWMALGLTFTSNCLWVSYWQGDIPQKLKKSLILFSWTGIVCTSSLTAIGWQFHMGWRAAVAGFILIISASHYPPD
ncbi:MAG: hypothetical protein LR011_10270 [Verrucomicrobia bacterium]|nr:hypothetical protein [Verrucomicrobiota bacterium]